MSWSLDQGDPPPIHAMMSNRTHEEAGERIGGRIYSVLFGNGYVDLGADRCYGETSNIVYELVKDYDLLKRPPEVFPDLYHSTRKLIEPKFKDELYQIYTEVYNEDRQGVHGSRSLGEHVTKRFFETIIQTWDSNNEKFLVASESIDLFHKWVLSHEGATSWFNVATKSDFEKIKGNQHLHWNGVGFKTIFDVLMKKSPDLEHNILLYKEVNEIEWNVSDKTIVSCLDGSTYQADHVILTVSLGVLKRQELGMGTVTKMFLRFRNSWWNEDFAGYSFLWDEQDLEKPGMFFDGPIKNGKSWITSILAILPVPNNPEVLEVWFTGEFVMEIEKCTSDTIINGIMFVLSVFEVCDFGDLIRPYQILRFLLKLSFGVWLVMGRF
ncbi:hypothetical protein FQA39_LY18687 [Lamprigera yunnana]|nr:hypothetical protein FQA39_LY18687 [Lamprigera yunnana]